MFKKSIRDTKAKIAQKSNKNGRDSNHHYQDQDVKNIKKKRGGRGRKLLRHRKDLFCRRH